MKCNFHGFNTLCIESENQSDVLLMQNFANKFAKILHENIEFESFESYESERGNWIILISYPIVEEAK